MKNETFPQALLVERSEGAALRAIAAAFREVFLDAPDPPAELLAPGTPAPRTRVLLRAYDLLIFYFSVHWYIAAGSQRPSCFPKA